MRRVLCAAAVVAALAAFADAQAVGWRGDGSGRFPNASPPTTWSKVSPRLAGLRCQAEKPKGDSASGAPAYTGAIAEWQVLGPLPAGVEGKAIDEAFVADEAALEPGAPVRGFSWRKVTVPGTTLDFSPLFEKDNPSFEYFPPHELNIIKAPFAAYAHTWLYSAEGGKVLIRVRARKAAKVWVNGELVFPSKAASVATLKKGWNRLLAKSTNTVMEKKPASVWTESDYPSWWFLDLSLTAVWPYEWTTKNIRWQTEMPSFGVACPVIVGDRIVVMAEPGRVLCVDKKDGRILWDRESSFWDTLTDVEQKAPAFKDAASLAAALDAIRGRTTTGPLAADVAKERDDLVAKIGKAMEQADATRFTVKVAGHGNCLPTPASDGKALYVVLGNGLVASYTLDGQLRWASAVSPGRNQEHGTTSSAALTADTLLVFHMDLAGIDLTTGRVRWKTDIWRKEPPYGDITHQTPVVFRVANEDYAFIHGIILRVSDGELVRENRAWTERQVIPTPVIDGGTLYELTSSGHLLWGPLPTSADAVALGKPAEVPTFSRILGAASRGFTCASPLIHNGLVYAVDCMGTLFVIDVKEKTLVYKQVLGTGFEARSSVHVMGTAYASPVLAGGNICVFGMDGTTVVFKAGRAYQEVARNKIEDIWNPTHWSARPEGFASTPVAEGRFLYVRGDKYLYCIGEK